MEISPLDKYGFFELTGQTSVPEDEQKRFNDRLAGLVLKEYLLDVINNCTDEELLMKVKELADKKDMDAVVKLAAKKIPGFITGLAEFTRKEKAKTVVGYFQNLLDFCLKERKEETREKLITLLDDRIKTISLALQLAKDGEWEKLKRFAEKYLSRQTTV